MVDRLNTLLTALLPPQSWLIRLAPTCLFCPLLRATRLPNVASIWDLLAEHCGPNTVLIDPSSGASAGAPLALTFDQVQTRSICSS